MKKLMIMISAIGMLAIPSVAQANSFTGVRGEITAGVDDVTNTRDVTDVTYGVAAGIDAPLLGSDNFTIGVEASLDNVFDRRDVAASARLGYKLLDDVLLYGKAGYVNFRDSFSRDLDGFRVGGGMEYAVTDHVYVKAEYRYSDFESGVGKHGVVGGVGLRF